MTLSPRKPRDFGDGFTCASYLNDGHWLALTRPHARHGMVELTGAEEFDESSRGDQHAVRRYRENLTSARTAFLTPTASTDTSVLAHGALEDGSLWIRIRIAPSHDAPISLRLTFEGWLQRPPYAEITDFAPLPPISRETSVLEHGHRLTVSSKVTESTTEILVEADAASSSGWVRVHDGAVYWEGEWPPVDRGGDGPEIVVNCRLFTPWDPAQSRASTALTSGNLDETGETSALSRITNGAHTYILECCALRVDDDETVIITDHRLLPLSWTRDAYYMALLLMMSGGSDSSGVVGRHLRWLWGRARRDGAWMRSQLTNGVVKDPGVQADQQLYPILELLDFRRAFGTWPAPPPGSPRWGDLVTAALGDLAKDPATGLLTSEENPADELSSFNLTFSSQVLYWYVIQGLADWSAELNLDGGTFSAAAGELLETIREVFTVDGPDGALFAYEADGRGGYRLNGDANDLPTVLAPAWGFCTGDDEVWGRTMRFILSPANPSWSSGKFGGLGSAHTPGTWPLGDLQAYLFYDRVGEKAELDRVRNRLGSVAADDGLLPEAYHSETGEWTARHWFAWPAAAVGCAAISTSFTPATVR
ncbi:MAG: glycoside hydrolase family 125 protein [Micrococcales bacterium]|nr:glycoside hydrolase family 125 protein [Micrococcales bacterium]